MGNWGLLNWRVVWHAQVKTGLSGPQLEPFAPPWQRTLSFPGSWTSARLLLLLVMLAKRLLVGEGPLCCLLLLGNRTAFSLQQPLVHDNQSKVGLQCWFVGTFNFLNPGDWGLGNVTKAPRSVPNGREYPETRSCLCLLGGTGRGRSHGVSLIHVTQ